MTENTEGKSKQHPNTTWDECLEFIRIIDRKKLNKVSYNVIAEEYGLKNYSTKSFTQKVSTSKQFGLIETGNLTIQLTDIAKRILYPISDLQVKKITLECFSKPPLYKQLAEKYEGKAVPTENILSNILFNEFDITKSAKDNAAHVFLQNAEMMGVLIGGVLHQQDNEIIEEQPIIEEVKTEGEQSENVKEEAEKIEETSTTKNNSYFTINIPTSTGKPAQIQIPNDLETKDAELVKNMLNANIEVYFKGKFGI